VVDESGELAQETCWIEGTGDAPVLTIAPNATTASKTTVSNKSRTRFFTPPPIKP